MLYLKFIFHYNIIIYPNRKGIYLNKKFISIVYILIVYPRAFMHVLHLLAVCNILYTFWC